MKKIIPIISLIGAGAVFAGLTYGGNTSSDAQIKNESLDKNLTYFQENVDNFNNIQNNKSYTTTSYGKYELTLSVPNGATFVNSETEKKVNDNSLKDTKEKKDILNNPSTETNITNYANNTGATTLELTDEYYDSLAQKTAETNENVGEDLTKENLDNDEDSDLDEEDTEEENEDENSTLTNDENEKISTLYSLSSDIEEECEDFVLLKDSITNAITETRNLIEKVNSSEIELSNEQRLYISKQSNELKTLGKELSKTTTELNLYLSDLSEIFKNDDGNLDDLSVKYLLVLDNLVNGNEMLENGLTRIRLMNSLFNMSNTLQPNNTGRIVYGFRQNNNPPIVKDYIINEDGTITENNADSDENSTETNQSNNDISTLDSTNISNIDTYNSGISNIDTFFNTALLDNEFMFGRNGYGYGGLGMYGTNYGYGFNNNYQNRNFYGNPNNGNYSMQNTDTMESQNSNDEQNNKVTQSNNTTTNGVSNEYNTPNNETHEKKRFNFKKNIDTYRSENTPTLNARFSGLKENVSSFFSKISNPHTKNPVYRFNEEGKQLNEF